MPDDAALLEQLRRKYAGGGTDVADPDAANLAALRSKYGGGSTATAEAPAPASPAADDWKPDPYYFDATPLSAREKKGFVARLGIEGITDFGTEPPEMTARAEEIFNRHLPQVTTLGQLRQLNRRMDIADRLARDKAAESGVLAGKAAEELSPFKKALYYASMPFEGFAKGVTAGGVTALREAIAPGSEEMSQAIRERAPLLARGAETAAGVGGSIVGMNKAGIVPYTAASAGAQRVLGAQTGGQFGTTDLADTFAKDLVNNVVMLKMQHAAAALGMGQGLVGTGVKGLLALAATPAVGPDGKPSFPIVDRLRDPATRDEAAIELAVFGLIGAAGAAWQKRTGQPMPPEVKRKVEADVRASLATGLPTSPEGVEVPEGMPKATGLAKSKARSFQFPKPEAEPPRAPETGVPESARPVAPPRGMEPRAPAVETTVEPRTPLEALERAGYPGAKEAREAIDRLPDSDLYYDETAKEWKRRGTPNVIDVEPISEPSVEAAKPTEAAPSRAEGDLDAWLERRGQDPAEFTGERRRGAQELYDKNLTPRQQEMALRGIRGSLPSASATPAPTGERVTVVTPEGNTHEGTVVERSGGKVTVKYDDGFTVKVPDRWVKPTGLGKPKREGERGFSLFPAKGVEAVEAGGRAALGAARAPQDYFSSQSFPALEREAGQTVHKEALSAASVPTVARVEARIITKKIAGILADKDTTKFRAAQNELNAMEARAKANPLDPASETEAPSNVGPGRAFPTEEAFQQYIQRPDVLEAGKAWEAWRSETNDPMYRYMTDKGESVDLPGRGGPLGRVNLVTSADADAEAEMYGGGSALGKVVRKRGGFTRQAKGTGEYENDMETAVRVAQRKIRDPYHQNRLYDELLAAKKALPADEGGPASKIDGEPVRWLPIDKSRTIVVKGEEGTRSFSPKSGGIWVKESIYNDVLKAVGGYKPLSETSPRQRKAQGLVRGSTALSLAGLGDSWRVMWRSLAIPATAGASAKPLTEAAINLIPGGRVATALYRVGDVLLRAARGTPDEVELDIAKSASARDLVEMEAMEGPIAKGLNAARPLRIASQTLSRVADRLQVAGREAMKAGMDRAKAAGVNIDTSPSAVSRNLNQLGRYQTRAKGAFQRFAASWGLQPFFEAWRTRIGNAGRRLVGDTGVRGLDATTEFKMRLLGASRLMGVMSTYFAWNLIHTNGDSVWGPPGQPIGTIYWGKDDEGKPRTLDLFEKFGLRDLANLTGVVAYFDAQRRGLDDNKAWEAAVQSVGRMGLGPVRGPIPAAVSIVATGKRDFGLFGAQRVSREGQPGEKQLGLNFGRAVAEAAPEVDLYAKALDSVGGLAPVFRKALGYDQPDSPGLGEFAYSQVKGILGTTGKSLTDEEVAKLPARVHYRDLMEFVDDAKRRLAAMPEDTRRDAIREMAKGLEGRDLYTYLREVVPYLARRR